LILLGGFGKLYLAMNVKKIGIFGGSFDPVHNGHLKLAVLAQKQFNLNSVIFVPAKLAPHKQESFATIKDRLAMLKLALKPYKNFKISSFELNQKGTTYTYQTLAHFKKLFTHKELFFLLGSDSLSELIFWKNSGEIVSQCHILAAKRGKLNYKIPDFAKNSVLFLKNTIPNISSTQIRDIVKENKSIRTLVPPKVVLYIKRNKIYQ